MIKKSDVSIVVPAYGLRGDALQRALNSVRRAEVDSELIVVDDGTPGTSVAELCKTIPAVRYIRRHHNGGVAAAQNTGLAAVTGKYVFPTQRR